ncbi:MAG: hypothetical protein AAGJ87_15495 [Pseudomonadota bacterium]
MASEIVENRGDPTSDVPEEQASLVGAQSKESGDLGAAMKHALAHRLANAPTNRLLRMFRRLTS